MFPLHRLNVLLRKCLFIVALFGILPVACTPKQARTGRPADESGQDGMSGLFTSANKIQVTILYSGSSYRNDFEPSLDSRLLDTARDSIKKTCLPLPPPRLEPYETAPRHRFAYTLHRIIAAAEPSARKCEAATREANGVNRIRCVAVIEIEHPSLQQVCAEAHQQWLFGKPQ